MVENRSRQTAAGQPSAEARKSIEHVYGRLALCYFFVVQFSSDALQGNAAPDKDVLLLEAAEQRARAGITDLGRQWPEGAPAIAKLSDFADILEAWITCLKASNLTRHDLKSEEYREFKTRTGDLSGKWNESLKKLSRELLGIQVDPNERMAVALVMWQTMGRSFLQLMAKK